MISRAEHEFAEVLVDKLVLESFANEDSPYHTDGVLTSPEVSKRLRTKIKWHIRNSLSERQRQVIEAYYLQGKTEREIATDLGIAQQVVNIYKHRAIKKLHKAIEV